MACIKERPMMARVRYINFITYLDSILNDLSTTYVPDTTNVNKEEKEKQKV